MTFSFVQQIQFVRLVHSRVYNEGEIEIVKRGTNRPTGPVGGLDGLLNISEILAAGRGMLWPGFGSRIDAEGEKKRQARQMEKDLRISGLIDHWIAGEQLFDVFQDSRHWWYGNLL